jgi:hypothetical protein
MGDVKAYKDGKESQRGWNIFFGNEGGLIQPLLPCKVYTIFGTKDSMGVMRKLTSLQSLIADLKDFESQETILCLKAREMRIMID